MTDTFQKIGVLAIAITLVGASMGYGTNGSTTSYFTDHEVGNVGIEMPENPSASANDSNPVNEGESVELTAAGSTDDSGIVAYEWDFDGDGSIDATGMNQTHTFTDDGEYDVTLVVTDTAGLVDTATTTVVVENVPPTASVGDDRTVDVDEQVTFDASGTTDPGDDELQYQWDVDDDGEYETDGVRPTHTYRSEGTHEVTMRVTDGDGGADTDTLSVTVQNVPPTADAGENLTVVTGEPTLDASGSSPGDSSDTMTYEWDVDGDDEFETTGREPGYIYDETGTYNVTLRASDGDGGVDTDETTVTVEPDTEPPVAEVATARTNVNDKSITFDGSGSTDNARIVSYEWDFDDGTTATGETVSHNYSDPSEYNVTLTVTDSAGHQNTTNTSIRIENVPPTADAGEDQTLVAGEPTTLDGTGSSEGDISDSLQFEWDLDDDGEFETTDPAPSTIYSENGTYNVTLRVSDGDGGVDTDATTIAVEPDTEPPSSNFEVRQTAPTNETVSSDGSGSADNARIVSYEWDFGDGTTATGPTPSHTYSDPAEYNVTLTVTDSAGYTDTKSVTVGIENVPPTADAGEDQTLVAGQSAMLDGSGSSEGDEYDDLSYEWDVDGDGEFESTSETVSHSYDEIGTYNATLRVNDGDGGVDTDATTITVEPDTEAPVADVGENQSASVNETVSFDGSNSSDNVEIDRYEWDFGDGTTETGATPSHAFDKSGVYTVTLTVTDSSGNTDTATIEVEVSS
jgi:PKD repeat protein